MKKLLLIIFSAILIGNTSTAQSAKSVFGEFGGNGLIFSGNFDARFKGEKGLGYRAGIGFATAGGISVVTFPLGLNHLIGTAPHYLELGVGATFTTVSLDFFDDGGADASGWFVMPTMGYRFNKIGKGFQGRIYVGPVFISGEVFFPWGGLSAGFKF